MQARTHTYTRTHTVCMLKQIYQQSVSWCRHNQLLFTCSNLGGNLLICVLCEWLPYNTWHDFRGEGFSLHADHRQRQRVCSPACTQLGRSQPDTATSTSRAGQSGRCMLSVEFWGLSPKLFWKKSNNNKSCNLVWFHPGGCLCAQESPYALYPISYVSPVLPLKQIQCSMLV